ncbi:MAG: nickel transporter permease [Acidimicrobiales bacterium]
MAATVPLDHAVGLEQAAPRPLARPILRKLTSDLTARIGLGLVALFLLIAAVGPSLAPHDPREVTTDRLVGPSLDHLLGTDGLGRDLFSRLLHGARLTLGTALLAAVLVTAIGLVIGTLSGYAGGLVDSLLMRVVDMVLAIPGLVLALAVAGLFEPSLVAVMLGLVTIWWAGYARVVRGLVLSVRNRPFVEAAHAVGASRWRILVRHILPSVVSPVIVLATLDVGQLVLVISGLTFLGLGAPPPTPEWGAMLNDGRVYFLSDPQVVIIPGIAISLAVLGFNLLGDGIRDALDPRLTAAGATARPRLLGRRWARRRPPGP